MNLYSTWNTQSLQNQQVLAVPLPGQKLDSLVHGDQYAMFFDGESKQIRICYLLMAEYPVTERFGKV